MVLPVPFAPINAARSRSFMKNDTSCNRSRLPNDFLMFVSVTTAIVMPKRPWGQRPTAWCP